MKKGKVLLCLTLLLSIGAARANNLRVEPDAYVQVIDDHKFVTAGLKNANEADIFCDTVTLNIVRSGSDYNDFASHAHIQSGPIYLPRGQEIDLSALGTKLSLASQGVTDVASADLDISLCRPATFAEYCTYAKKDADETYTTELILRASGRDCAETEAAIGRNLNLAGGKIRSLKPLGFLQNLYGLSLAHNQIEDLSPLRDLDDLRALDISFNGVRDLSPIMNLIALHWVNATATLVQSYTDPIKSWRHYKLYMKPLNAPRQNVRK